MRKRYRLWVALDVDIRSTAKAIISFEGVEYELTATPANSPLDELLEDDGNATFGGEPVISLGPRDGDVCPYCGR